MHWKQCEFFCNKMWQIDAIEGEAKKNKRNIEWKARQGKARKTRWICSDFVFC